MIDSPGFQEFGLRHIAADRLAALMPDLARATRASAASTTARIATSRAAASCAALERGEIAESRYRIYREIFEELSPREPARSR